MAKLTELKDEEALIRLADIIEPISEIMTTPEVVEAAKTTRINAVKAAMKYCGKTVMKALAIYNGVPVEEYHTTAIKALKELMDIVNDPELAEVFSSPERKTEN